MRKHKNLLRLSAVLLVVIQLAVLLPTTALFHAEAASPAKNQNSEEYLMRAREFFDKYLYKMSEKEEDPNEVIRVLVETDEKSAAEASGEVEYTDDVKAAEEHALDAQLDLIKKVEALTGTKVINRTAYLVNGFSIEMKRSMMDTVAKLDGVKAVHPVTTFRKNMDEAVNLTSVSEMWEAENGGYTGEGIVIAVVDSGVNYTHPDMQLDEGAAVKFTEAEMEEKIAELGYGAFYTDKVPFGYSYGGKSDNDVNNDYESHGLHVSGIAAANGEIKGVAPNAQLFAMQVFTDQNTAYTDDIIRAVEDSVKLGADVINLSLGSGAGFYSDVEYLRRALSYAEENNVICCVAAGNDGVASSLYGEATNEWGVVDTSAVSSPASFPGALSVSSFDNIYVTVPVIDIYADGELVCEGHHAVNFAPYEYPSWDYIYDLPIIDCDGGTAEEFDEITGADDFYDKTADGEYIALITRDQTTFAEKIMNAYYGYASAVIIYNNEETDEVPSGIASSSAGDYMDYMPSMFVSGNLGAELKALAAEGALFSFEGFYEARSYLSKAPGMSSFTSWGPTPTLDIKPEITAPGGSIMSTSYGDGYEYMSGTSMATPYVSGASALVIEAVKKAVDSGELTLPDGMNLSEFVKRTMMNTADPLYDGDKIFSVRRQGAGMVDPLGAANNRVIVTYNGEAAAALHEVGETTEFVLTLTNCGDEEAVYTLPSKAPVYTDYTDPETSEYCVVAADAEITFDRGEVRVPAGESVEVKATLTLGSKFEDGHFAEGYVVFDGEDAFETLVMPVLAFYGDWDDAGRIVDLPWYDEDNLLTNFYAQYFSDFAPGTGLVSAAYSEYYGLEGMFLGLLTENDVFEFTPEHYAFSPNGDDYFDVVQPALTMLRSAGTVYFDIVDEDGNLVRRVNTAKDVGRLFGYSVATQGALYQLLNVDIAGDGTWDGTVYDSKTGEYVPAAEGQYYVRISAAMPGSDKLEETVMPVKLDTTAPEFEIVDVSCDEYGDVNVSFTAEDYSGFAGVASIVINGYLDPYGQSMVEIGYNMTYDEETGVYTATVPMASYLNSDSMNEVAVVGVDYAQNEGIAYYYSDVTFDAPVVFTNVDMSGDPVMLKEFSYAYNVMPDGTTEYSSIETLLRGVVSDAVASLTVNGVKMEIFANGSFTGRVPVTLGENTLEIKAYGEDGEELYSATKNAFVDFTSPELLAYVTDEAHSGEWSTDNVYCSYNKFGIGYAFATKYSYGDTVPLAVQVSDDNLTELTVTWYEGEFDEMAYNEIMFRSLSLMLYGEDTELSDAVRDSMHTVTISGEELEQRLDENGILTLDVPFFKFEYYDYDAYESFWYDEQHVVCQAKDVAGNVTTFTTVLEGGEHAEGTYNMYGDTDVRDITGDVIVENYVFETLEPLDPEWFSDTFTGYAVVTSDMLDEDGVLHLKGTLTDMCEGVYYNGEYIEGVPNEETGKLEVMLDVHGLNPGKNTVFFSFEQLWELVPWRLNLYFIPDGMESTVTFDNSAIGDGAVIYTNKDSFDVSGEIFSLTGDLNLKINGDQLLYLTEGGVDVYGGKTTGFTYTVALTEGENVVTVEFFDQTAAEITVRFTVVRDTAAPNAPEVTSDDKGNVTVKAEDGATIYYSLDGETWIEYTGTFNVKESGKVYAKAVDKAGNESAVTPHDVKLASPKPNDPPTPPSDDPVEPPVTSDSGSTAIYVCLLATALFALTLLYVDKKRASAK